MVPKENRLTSRYEFNKVKFLSDKLNSRFNGKFFNLIFARPLNYVGSSKFGIVVSKKSVASAVLRNTLKRKYRELLRGKLSDLNEGVWVVIYPKSRSIEASYEELSSSLTQVLQANNISK